MTTLIVRCRHGKSKNFTSTTGEIGFKWQCDEICDKCTISDFTIHEVRFDGSMPGERGGSARTKKRR